MKGKLKAVGWALLAAVTTPQAIKAEKNLAVIVLARFAILMPSAAWVCARLIDLLT